MQTHSFQITVYLLSLSGCTILYILTAFYLKRSRNPQKRKPARLPHVVVLIAVRNEEKYIRDCLQAFEQQTYPEDHFLVTVIDDQSTDSSAKIAEEICKKNINFKLHPVREERYGLKGKMNALEQALDDTDAELVLITDADCIVPPSWIETFVEYFAENTGLVAGLTLLQPGYKRNVPQKSFSLFQKVQTLDWLFLQLVSSYASQAGRPITVLGNNFGFRKKAYDQTGGFKNIGFSVTEDYALMEAIRRQGSWKICHTIDPGNTIFSFPLQSLKEFYNQRKRWISGGRKSGLWAYFLMLLSTLLHFLLLSSLLLSGFYTLKVIFWLSVLITDFMILSPELDRSGLKPLKKYFLIFEVFYIFYSIVFAVLALFPSRVTWKGRSYT